MDPHAHSWNPYGHTDPRYAAAGGAGHGAVPPATGGAPAGGYYAAPAAAGGYYPPGGAPAAVPSAGGYADPYAQQRQREQQMLLYQQMRAQEAALARAHAAGGSGGYGHPHAHAHAHGGHGHEHAAAHTHAHAGAHGHSHGHYDARGDGGGGDRYDHSYDSYDRSYDRSHESRGGVGTGARGGGYHEERDAFEEPVSRPVRIAKRPDYDDDSDDGAAAKKAVAVPTESGPVAGGGKKKRRRARKKKKGADVPAAKDPSSEPKKAKVVVSKADSAPGVSVSEVVAAVASLTMTDETLVESKTVEVSVSKSKASTATASASPSPASEAAVDEEKVATTTSSSRKKKKKKSAAGRKRVYDPHDPREHLNLVLIGHVDAGKSTISGQILLLTGQIDRRTIEKYEKEAKERGRESWWIAYIMDEDDEERAKGKTVECGRAHFDTAKKRYTILDAPGHKNYVPNMISGASQADVAVLVVSARRGEFEAGFDRGGQTREHSLLAWTLGINRLVIAVNKMDACDFSQERYEQIVKDTSEHLKEVGFAEKNISALPLSGQCALNITKGFDSGVCTWYKGLNLLQTLDAMRPLKRKTKKPLRIPVLDRYKGDSGLTAIGKIEAGVLSVGDSVQVLPTGHLATVSHICVDDTPVETAGAGENVLVSFHSKSKVNYDSVYSGSVISSVESPCSVVRKFHANMYICDTPTTQIMTAGYTAMLHVHNCAVQCEVSRLLHRVQKRTGRLSKKAPTVLRMKDLAVVEVTVLGHPIPLETYHDVGQLGRFALRDQDKTVVIGKVVKLCTDA